MPFRIIRDDIAKIKADALVNMSSKSGERDKPDKLQTPSSAVAQIVPSLHMNSKYVIYVDKARCTEISKDEEAILRNSYDKALDIAVKKRCKSIAFPLLTRGEYGLSKKSYIQIALDSFTAFLEEHEMQISLIVPEYETDKISDEFACDMSAYINERHMFEILKEPEKAVYACAFADIEVKCNESLDSALKSIYTDSFEKHLQKLINKKGLKNSQVYAAANISKQYFSKLLKGQVKPSKEKMLALSVGLRLNIDETIDFLRIAGYALSPISQTDIIVQYFIRRQDYNVLKIDIVLFDYGLDPLSGVQN